MDMGLGYKVSLLSLVGIGSIFALWCLVSLAPFNITLPH